MVECFFGPMFLAKGNQTNHWQPFSGASESDPQWGSKEWDVGGPEPFHGENF